MGDYYDWDGKPITMEEWVELFHDNRLALTKVGGDCTVSTVYLGLDHSWGDEAPMIFETLVSGGPMDQDMFRYSTKQEAARGHENTVDRVKQWQRATSG